MNDMKCMLQQLKVKSEHTSCYLLKGQLEQPFHHTYGLGISYRVSPNNAHTHIDLQQNS